MPSQTQEASTASRSSSASIIRTLSDASLLKKNQENSTASRQKWKQRTLEIAPVLIDSGFGAVDIAAQSNYLMVSNRDQVSITLAWDGASGLLQIYSGYQYLKREDSHKVKNKIKGTLNILGGMQLFLLSHTRWLHELVKLFNEADAVRYIPQGIEWAGWAFAGGMLADWAVSAIELYQSARLRHFPTWLEDKVDEAIFLKNKKDSENSNGDDARFKTLLEQIKARCRVHFHPAASEDRAEDTKPLIKTQLKRLQEALKLSEVDTYTQTSEEADKSIEKELKNQASKDFWEASALCFIKSLGAVSMTMYAINPEIEGSEEMAAKVIFASFITLYSMYYIILIIRSCCMNKELLNTKGEYAKIPEDAPIDPPPLEITSEKADPQEVKVGKESESSEKQDLPLKEESVQVDESNVEPKTKPETEVNSGIVCQETASPEKTASSEKPSDPDKSFIEKENEVLGKPLDSKKEIPEEPSLSQSSSENTSTDDQEKKEGQLEKSSILTPNNSVVPESVNTTPVDEQSTEGSHHEDADSSVLSKP